MPCTIRLLPDHRSCTVDGPMDLASAAALCDVLVEQPCGSKRSCGKCRVRVVAGANAPTAEDRRVLDDATLAMGWRLGCGLVVANDITVEVPRAARAVAAKSFGDDTIFTDGRFVPAEPVVVARAREGNRRPVGVAIDAGSTTLAVALVELERGTVLATASALNPQVRFGADVVSRIRHAQDNPGGSEDLHLVLVAALDELIAGCAHDAGVAPPDLACVTAVGNPTMMHSFVGRDVMSLGQAPYEGSLRGAWRATASAVGFSTVNAVAPVYVPPGIRSHVGADAVAAILATGIDLSDRLTLMIDLGTNTEIVLGDRDGLSCTSASAGPAFEGASILQGMRAAPGAIEQVRVRAGGSLIVRTIGNAPAVGLCGSGLVDAVAELVRADVIETSGRMRAPGEIAAPALRERVVELPGGGRAVRLADGEPPVHLAATDVRQLQLVKGSIAASTRMLLERRGATVDDLASVLIAGAFGGWIRKASAQAIGLVPDIDPERIAFVGDAAAVGARMALVDHAARDRAEQVARRAEYVELAGHHEYAELFVASLSLATAEEGVA